MKPGLGIIIYFCLLFFYFGQGFMFGEENAIGRPALVCVLSWNLYYLLRCTSLTNKPKVLGSVLTFVALNILYYAWGELFVMNVPSTKSFQILKGVLLSMTCIFPAYYWSRKGYNLKPIALLLAAGYFTAIYIAGLNKGQRIDFVDNMGYYYLNFIPFLFLIRNKTYLKIALCLLLNVLIISCAKRGAIITAGIVDAVFVYYICKDNHLSRNLLYQLWILLPICCAGIFVWNELQSNAFVLERFTALEQGNSSGRNVIYENLWINWSHHYDLVEKLFGGGFCKSPRINGGLFAHNDWLELLTDIGLLGIVAYTFVICSMVSLAIRAKNRTIKYCMVAISAIWILKTMFSMSYLDENSFILMLLAGMLAAKIKCNETEETTLGQYA